MIYTIYIHILFTFCTFFVNEFWIWWKCLTLCLLLDFFVYAKRYFHDIVFLYSEAPLKINYTPMKNNVVKHSIQYFNMIHISLQKNHSFWKHSEFSKKISDRFLIFQKYFLIFEFSIWPPWWAFIYPCKGVSA